MKAYDTTGLLTWWESPDGVRRVECRRRPGGYEVVTLYAGRRMWARLIESEPTARGAFERAVERLAREEN